MTPLMLAIGVKQGDDDEKAVVKKRGKPRRKVFVVKHLKCFFLYRE